MERTIQSDITASPTPCPRCGGVLGPMSGFQRMLNRGLVCRSCRFSWTPEEAVTGEWHRGKDTSFASRRVPGDADTLLVALLLVLAAMLKGLITGVMYSADGEVSDNEVWTTIAILHLVIPAAVGFFAGRRSSVAPVWILLCPAATMVTAYFSGLMSGEWAFFGFLLAVVFAIGDFLAALAGVAIGDWLRMRAGHRL